MPKPFRQRPAFSVGKGRIKPGDQNKQEERYDAFLSRRHAAGEIIWYNFEPWKLRLADMTFYSPDFGVMLADGSLECHEVKGFWEDAARIKIKVAATIHPFRFVAVREIAKKHGGGYEFEVFE